MTVAQVSISQIVTRNCFMGVLNCFGSSVRTDRDESTAFTRGGGGVSENLKGHLEIFSVFFFCFVSLGGGVCPF